MFYPARADSAAEPFLDLSAALSFLLGSRDWSALIDGDRIGVAGHSQGGFTALWIGGAEVSAAGYRAFQEGWRNNRMVPEHLRRDLPVDPTPALQVCDPRPSPAARRHRRGSADILPRVALGRSRPPAPLICVNPGGDDSRYKGWYVQLATNP